MTANFDALVQIAMLGTERQAPPEPGTETALGALQAQVSPANREQALLSLAALAGLHERAGSLPVRAGSALPSAAAEETASRATDLAGSFLVRLLKGEFGGISSELLLEWLRIAAETNQLAPPEALPLLLDLGAAKMEQRDAIVAVLGERGRWLANQNLNWSWVHAVESLDDSIWQTGEPAARLAFLRNLRRSDAAKARELVGSTWKEETPEDRATFLGGFETGLGAADEEFLEQALGDKRKEVRRIAATLLARIPNSRFVSRLTSRAKQVLRFTAAEEGRLVKLKRPKRAAIEMELPPDDDKALRQDGLDSKPPKGIGEKAWLVIQMLELVPLGAWTEAWKISPAEIVNVSSMGEWKSDLLEAWLRAAILQQEAAWVDPLFPIALEEGKIDRLSALMEIMTSETAESHLTTLLKTKDDKVQVLQGPLLAAAVHAWTPKFSRHVLDWLRTITAKESYDWMTRNLFIKLAPRFAPDVLRETTANWPVESKGWDFWRSGVDDLISAAQFRDEMIRALRQRT